MDTQTITTKLENEINNTDALINDIHKYTPYHINKELKKIIINLKQIRCNTIEIDRNAYCDLTDAIHEMKTIRQSLTSLTPHGVEALLKDTIKKLRQVYTTLTYEHKTDNNTDKLNTDLIKEIDNIIDKTNETRNDHDNLTYNIINKRLNTTHEVLKEIQNNVKLKDTTALNIIELLTKAIDTVNYMYSHHETTTINGIKYGLDNLTNILKQVKHEIQQYDADKIQTHFNINELVTCLINNPYISKSIAQTANILETKIKQDSPLPCKKVEIQRRYTTITDGHNTYNRTLTISLTCKTPINLIELEQLLQLLPGGRTVKICTIGNDLKINITYEIAETNITCE